MAGPQSRVGVFIAAKLLTGLVTGMRVHTLQLRVVRLDRATQTFLASWLRAAPAHPGS